MKQLSLSELDDQLIAQYRNAVQYTWPKIILHSELTKANWYKVETYFPHCQRFLIDDHENLIGFINTLPIFWDQAVEELPEEGWDWLLTKAISDFENNIKPNTLGGLQVIVTKEYLSKGFSKLLIQAGKQWMEELAYSNFIIPIRPTEKHKYAEMKMQEYMQMKIGDKVADPWIRTHLNSGAEIIKVCSKSMHVTGDLRFWESLIGKKMERSGTYLVEGALNLVTVDVEKNYGEYWEENVWVRYGG